MPDFEAREICDQLLAAGRDATSLALSFYDKPLKSWSKSNASPVTEADIAVDTLLKERLTRVFPEAGWLSEETADTADRLACEDVLIVDPIDGTRAFMAGLPDWTVSLAYARAGKVLAAVLMEPVAGRAFHAARGHGAFADDTRLKPSASASFSGLNVAGPKPLVDAFSPEGARVVPKIHSLALRLVRVASGDLAAGLASGRAHDWDIAAADLIVTESGALLTDFDGHAPVYNAAQPVHPPLLAAAPHLHGAGRQLLQPRRVASRP